MTAGELKFAVQVEKALNSLSHPEYRQLVVEALMLVAIVVQQDRGQGLGRILVVDHVIQAAHTQFLEDQVRLLQILAHSLHSVTPSLISHKLYFVVVALSTY